MKKEQLIVTLINARISATHELIGCTDTEITELENLIGLNLPQQYKEFLRAVGKGAGKFLQGTDIFLSALTGLKSEANALLTENSENFSLPDDAFVFSMHQGYEFTYFNTTEGDDPPVYQYVEGNGSPLLTWQSFSDFVKEAIENHTRQ